MKRTKGALFLFLLLVLCALHVEAQVTIEIRKVPAKTPPSDTLYLAGNVNNWKTRSASFAFRKAANNRYYLTLPPREGELEYKVTRGSWETGETLANGAGRGNRFYQVKPGKDTVRIEVENWQDNFPTATKTHTATPNVKILSNEFWMPQLKRSRRIWLYLPPNYASSDKKYPVLYMHDGQNLFDAFYGFSGEWGVDESLNQMFQSEGQEVIVVGVDNGGEERMNEYSPWKNAKHGGGQGDAYVDFLVQTLKPYIDKHYRTLTGPEHTGVAGSSMGGLISMYAALKYPQVYGKAGVFSPAFWVAPQVYDYAAKTKPSKDLKLCLVAGAKEGKEMVPDMARMRDLLVKQGLKPSSLKYQVHADGEHKESFWQREFPDVFRWLFSN
ncbi:alpha/beta hydrolase-fold protein [Rufibacter latericius]|uniref:Alpha/beta hydrolase n=1 Tax=Rufibacter latericius TaxID=2487040 RepID=A0A3M9MW14_9BACT|nr:alpha/beta hydrolase-fold protein [Rufibacter latericius]RNI28948.1 alpha/beta hydrolase [Rufibacter latericius]